MNGHNGPSFFSREYWTEVGVIPRWQLLAVYSLVVGAGLAGFIDSNHRRDDLKEQSRETAARLAEQTRSAAAGIKESRRQAVIATCREQNARHDNTLAELDRQIMELPPARRARAERNRVGTEALIDALAPKQDCVARARRLVP
jgi:predicted kinase